MKPIVYLAAFRQGGFNLETIVPDEPIGVPDGEKQNTKWISNYDDQFRGMIPVREALAESRNAVAIWLTDQIGIASVLQTSLRLGIQTRLHPYAATALGASEVNLLELANAYRTMASGILAVPYLIRKIIRGSGEVAGDKEDGNAPGSMSTTPRLRSFRKACVVSCESPPARLIRLTPAFSQSRSWARQGRQTSSEMRSLLARPSALKESPSPFV